MFHGQWILCRNCGCSILYVSLILSFFRSYIYILLFCCMLLPVPFIIMITVITLNITHYYLVHVYKDFQNWYIDKCDHVIIIIIMTIYSNNCDNLIMRDCISFALYR